jgi:protein-L-isoaspartate(D-aspartate) O-methyltransferase
VDQDSSKNAPSVASERKFLMERQRLIATLRQRGIANDAVLCAIEATPREFFVPEALRGDAYGDHALPISDGQTISQPFIVARMTELLELSKSSRVLEVGAGSGYQTAILAQVAGQVFAIERIANLARLANARMRALGFTNVTIKCFDGTVGWTQFAPYDGILVAAAGPTIPQPLVDQLAVGGRLILPVGNDQEQRLILISRTPDGFRETDCGAARFVPLLGKYGR